MKKDKTLVKRNRHNTTAGATPASNHSAPEQMAEPTKDATESADDAHDGGFRIVGIGASAGGLDALKEFFGAMPADSGMAYVTIQHLEPTRESHMAEILAKYTTMKVIQAEDGASVEPNTVYTNPPGRTLSIRDGRLRLGKSTGQNHVEAAIDHFLTSLTEEKESHAVCIILSGSSGSDGPRGVRAVRAAGGICMVQEPSSAQFSAMPQAVIDTGLADYVLSPTEMPASLLDFVHHRQNRENVRTEPAAKDADDVEAILKLLRMRTNSNYSHYKRATVIRRIQRRMGLQQITDMGEYIRLLRQDPNELTQLARDMLIGVSSFFRDASAFEDLRVSAIEPMVQTKQDGAPLRAWVPGCATGEEAYSIAMLLLEAQSAAGKSCPVQVFATDVDEQSLETARAGAYSLSIADDVPSELLERYFVRQAQTYQVEKHLREAVVFSRHNLLTDPPFSKLDLISCRNVLIYIESPAQKKVLSVFSFSINVGGYLFLGKSEGVTGMEDLFQSVSKQNRLYRLTRSNRQAAGEFPLYAAGRQTSSTDREQAVSNASVLQQANLEGILRHFDASVVLVEPDGKILYFSGQTEKYLGHPTGPASLNILDMTGGTLSAKLRRAMERALHQDEAISLAQVPLPQERTPLANVTVMRIPDRAGGGRLLAVIFEDVPPHRHSTTHQPVAAEEEPLVAQLEAEIKTLRSELRTNTEGYDSATEELKAANEEVMSMNEELQSANEELEASKEELQSVNEELTTVNSQLNDKLGELTEANNDLANLLMATEIATIFLDTQLRIRRYTPRATDLLNLIKSDLGRPIGHITQNFTGVDLTADAGEVLKCLSSTEKEIQTKDGQWYTVRILPYRTVDDRIGGTVVTFSDVTRLKAAEQDRREFEGRMLHVQKLESLGVLAGGIAHDFNNILTAMLGNMELALMEPEGSKKNHVYVKEAKNCALRAAELTAQMLSYSGKGVFELRHVNLNEIVRDMARVAEAALSRNVSVEYRLDASASYIRGNATQLKQVVLNLLVNASEATAEAGGSITVTTQSRQFSREQLVQAFPDCDLECGDYVLLEVSDNGIGMDSATMARVFEPFYTTKFAGRGLGLAAVIGIVKSHHGAISTRSDVGVGSIFSVIFPNEEPLEELSEPPVEVEPISLVGSGTVLVVDDEESVRETTKAILDRAGFSVLTASEGAEAVNTFEAHDSEIRAVVLDVTMPGMKTEDILAKLDAIRPDIPILLCSGYSENEVSRRFAGMGVRGFVAKPFTRKTLLSSIARCLMSQV